MIGEHLYQALGGSGLTAQDYAGLTPEQIAMVAGQGQQDRQLISGVISNMQQQELAERKQAFDEMTKNREYQLMQNQDARAQMQLMLDASFKVVGAKMDQARLGLEAARTKSALATDEHQRKVADRQLAQMDAQQQMLKDFSTVVVELPFSDKEGKPAKTSLGAVLLGAPSLANDVFKSAVIKQSGGIATGSSNIWGVDMPGEDSSSSSGSSKITAEERQKYAYSIMLQKTGIPKPVADHLAMTGAGALATPQSVFEMLQKTSVQFQMNTNQEDKIAQAEDLATKINQANIDMLKGAYKDVLQAAGDEYDAQQQSAEEETEVSHNPVTSNATSGVDEATRKARQAVLLDAVTNFMESTAGKRNVARRRSSTK